MAAPSSGTSTRPGGRPGSLPWRRLASFAGLPLISVVGSLSVIPVITSVGGAQGWAAVALGQAVGASAATLLQWGWGFVGPTWVAGLDGPARAHVLWVSILSRLLVGALLLPTATGVAAMLAPDGHRLLAGLTALALGTWGLSAYWFFVGTGRPGQAARYESVPRLGVQLAACLGALVADDALWYPILFLTGQVLSIGWSTARLSHVSWSRETWRQAIGALRDQRAAAATDAVVAVLASLPTTITAAVAPGALAVFTAGDRVQRLAQSGIQPLYNAFQGWVSEVPAPQAAVRMRLAVLTTSAAGVLGGIGLGVSLPLVDRYLFSGTIDVPPAVSALFGLVLAVWALNAAISFDVLAPQGRTTAIFWGTAVGGVVALAGAASLPPVLGAAGGALAVLLSQLATLAVQLVACRRPGAPTTVAGEHRAEPVGCDR